MEQIKKIEIPIISGENGMMVDSRLLHQWLNVKSHHKDWVRRRIEDYNFVENRDFYFRSNLSENKRVKYQGRTAVEYLLSIDMAKELAMLENNDAGRAARWYFIEKEKQFRDWLGVMLPQLEIEKNLFGEVIGYDYLNLLSVCGLSLQSGSRCRRVRNHPQEFAKNQAGKTIVTEVYGRTIYANAIVRRLNGEAKGRRLDYFKDKSLKAQKS
jgi:phage anti-repressor protein